LVRSQWNLILEFQKMRRTGHAVEFSGKGQAPTATPPKLIYVVVGQRFDGSVLHPGIGRLYSVVVLRHSRQRQAYGKSQQKSVCVHAVLQIDWGSLANYRNEGDFLRRCELFGGKEIRKEHDRYGSTAVGDLSCSNDRNQPKPDLWHEEFAPLSCFT
jgi:hypothetical protein